MAIPWEFGRNLYKNIMTIYKKNESGWFPSEKASTILVCLSGPITPKPEGLIMRNERLEVSIPK